MLDFMKNNFLKNYQKGSAGMWVSLAIFAALGIGTAIGIYFLVSKKENYILIPKKELSLQAETESELNKEPENASAPNETNKSEVEKTGAQTQNKENSIALIKTNFGEIKLKLFDKDAPLTVQNFIKLSKSGFYNGVKFHRIIKGFMIQSGDPNSKDADWADDGRGGPGYSFPDEINSRKIVKGTLAMANSGPNTNGSQFFILTGDSAPWLDGKHTVFGEVILGMDIVLKIENAPTNGDAQGNHPLQDIIINTIEMTD